MKAKTWKIKHTLTVGFQYEGIVSSDESQVYLQFSDASLDAWYPVEDVVYVGEVSLTDNHFTKTRS